MQPVGMFSLFSERNILSVACVEGKEAQTINVFKYSALNGVRKCKVTEE